jgi:hypothetical protein
VLVVWVPNGSGLAVTTGSFAVRLAKIEQRISWRHVTFRHRSGAERTLPTAALVDAWVNTLLSLPHGIEPSLAAFIADAIPPRRNQSEMESAVFWACRDAFYPPPDPSSEPDDLDPPSHP